MRSSLLATTISTVFIAGTVGAAEPIDKVVWLAGCWAIDGAEPGSEERWMPLAGGTMLGVSRTIEQGKTVAFELMEIRHLPDGKLPFVAHPSGRATATFTALRVGDFEVIFESRTSCDSADARMDD
jgi:hypothetical protein